MSTLRLLAVSSVVSLFVSVACGGSSGPDEGQGGSSTGGAASGGTPSQGGSVVSTGGAPSQGGVVGSTGGSKSTGGTTSGSGGKAQGSGGKAQGSGGKAQGSGGKAQGSGGATASGGTSGTGTSCGTATCGPNQYCCNASCNLCTAMGAACIQIVCEPGTGGASSSGGATGASCSTAADCRLVDDYCTGCDCRALAKGAPDPVCTGTPVNCLIAPCQGHTVACRAGRCVVE